MSNRWSSQAGFATTSRSPSPNGHQGVNHADQSGGGLSSVPGVSQVEAWVKAEPGKSLLIALAAGLAIGWWVKRS